MFKYFFALVFNSYRKSKIGVLKVFIRYDIDKIKSNKKNIYHAIFEPKTMVFVKK